MKLTLGVDFISVQQTAFTLIGPKRVKIQSRSEYLFCTFGIYEPKSSMQNFDEIDTRYTINMTGSNDIKTDSNQGLLILDLSSLKHSYPHVNCNPGLPKVRHEK